MKDVTRCRFCSAQFKDSKRKARHFHKTRSCYFKLKELARQKLSFSINDSTLRVETKSDSATSDRIIEKSSCADNDTETRNRKIPRNIECSKCQKSFKGNASYYHHAVCNF